MSERAGEGPSEGRRKILESMSRRTYLTLVAAGMATKATTTSAAASPSPTGGGGATTASASAIEPDPLSIHGYGEGGYGEMPYGGGNPDDPTVTTGSATNVSQTEATLNGTLDDLAGESSVDVYFEYRETGANSWTQTSAQSRSSTGSFDETVTGLSEGTDYEYRAVVEVDGSVTDTGATGSFSTDDDGSSGNWWDPYTDDDEIASSAGQHIIPAINDFEDTGDPSAAQVVTLIESFETGTPVPDLI